MAAILRNLLVSFSMTSAIVFGKFLGLPALCQDTNIDPTDFSDSAVDHSVSPLRRAHAHNDYYHDRPLLDALDQGFCSVEADVFLIDGELRVAHSVLEIRKQVTLKKLYLDPLRERCAVNGGRVYQDGPRLILLIDFKTDAEPTYAALKALLAEYKEMLVRFEDGKIIEGAVQVIISGNRPVATMGGEVSRLAFLDGRMSDLAAGASPDLVPLISDQWSSQFKWRGRGAMPEPEQTKLKSIVDKAHARNCKLRFWGAPDNPACWRTLFDAQVDLINTDQLAELAAYLKSKNAANE